MSLASKLAPLDNSRRTSSIRSSAAAIKSAVRPPCRNSQVGTMCILHRNSPPNFSRHRFGHGGLVRAPVWQHSVGALSLSHAYSAACKWLLRALLTLPLASRLAPYSNNSRIASIWQKQVATKSGVIPSCESVHSRIAEALTQNSRTVVDASDTASASGYPAACPLAVTTSPQSATVPRALRRESSSLVRPAPHGK